MNKLTLDMDALTVESFEPIAGRGQAVGTVHGRSAEDSELPTECPLAYPIGTQEQSCDGTFCAETVFDCSECTPHCASAGVC